MVGKLYTPARLPGIKNLLVRLGIVLALLATTVLVVYFEGGHRDSVTGEAPDLKACAYFAMVTITTVGYGDIVPVTTIARLVDGFVLTVFRLIFFFVFFGTAYQLVLKRFQEEYRMKRAVEKLKDHTIVCGYGATGRAAVRELLQQGTDPAQIVVLDTAEEALHDAAEAGVVAIEGDATRENMLKSVAVEEAANVLVCMGRDDTAVLVALTVRALNSDCGLVAVSCEEENVKLLERSGASTVISPAMAGGTLMAAATHRGHLVQTMQDLLDAGGSMQLVERPTDPSEVGKAASAVDGAIVLSVYRDGKHLDATTDPTLRSGDTLVLASPRGL